ncbi:ATP-binding protein [Streptomyces sp. WMMC500]|uniref:ATP-binding protein n=1 Tax=Streptomyces sp. WMMC500 TaxID=3015154 RepID=UPI00248C1B50|nr:ATP-binding protein [Streptomyces sp. WMMC500]WBB63977.1 ATP-binding protein [Streptomyces sp. WMMC500]
MHKTDRPDQTVWGKCVVRKRWELDFPACPEEVAGLRRVLQRHLRLWGLPHVVHAAQLCATELVTNVVSHVGAGVPVTLTTSMRDTRLRLELHDPGTNSVPIPAKPAPDDETGRGLLLVAATAADWGVDLRDDGKTTWVELATGLDSPTAHAGGDRVTAAEALLILYRQQHHRTCYADSPLSAALLEDAATHLIADVLCWLAAHGYDHDEVLCRAEERVLKHA